MDASAKLFLQIEQTQMKAGDLFFDCHICGRIPYKCVKTTAKEIGKGYDKRVWWYFPECPGCNKPIVSVLWRL